MKESTPRDDARTPLPEEETLPAGRRLTKVLNSKPFPPKKEEEDPAETRAPRR